MRFLKKQIGKDNFWNELKGLQLKSSSNKSNIENSSLIEPSSNKDNLEIENK